MTTALAASPIADLLEQLTEDGEPPELHPLLPLTWEAHCPVCASPSLLVSHDEGREDVIFLHCASAWGKGCPTEALHTLLGVPRPGAAYQDGLTDDPFDTRPIGEVLGASKEDYLVAELTVEAILQRGRDADPLGVTAPSPSTVDDYDHRDTEIWKQDVEEAVWRLLVRDEARAQHEQRLSAALELPAVAPLTAFLAVEDNDAEFCIDGLLPTGGNAILAAAYKAGKSTFVGNVVRALADGQPVLGKYATEVRDVVLIDNELDERTLRRWIRDQGITNTDRVRVVSLRGKTSTFNILEDATRALWASQLRGADLVIFDCLRPVLDALGLDENKDAGRFLVAFDALKAEAGISEGVVVHHMGHGAERSRGDSRILDWPDVTWKIIRSDKDDPSSSRYFSAFGRDVDVAEARLQYDPSTRHLTPEGGSRKDAARDDALTDVVAFLRTAAPDEGASSKKIEEALLAGTSHGRAAIRAALKSGKDRGFIWTHAGAHGAFMHRLNPSSSPARQTSPPARRQGQNDLASAPIGRGEEDEENNELATEETGEVRCDVCSQPLHPIHASSGFTRCPSCESDTRKANS
ncbi:hypothetical protein C5E07_09785 [Pseudoclavibacter sp. RFBJ3]|uniref:AAA family ATPase n=1 Tax=unclassified Pseudoclavibacter TaxID=2615177 RepID=UPI000CE832B4|nr:MULTISPECIES: AAA family ATPase [unclassified Pseudoclavibacter]PPF83774.1 hypothetical protein C5C12_08865 [Pseudoclavibacter sp. RFBJ5]PPF92054.1 hypothetical protein C5E07_09785 [Pseudoclavibacter sp. RFBJ3]PPF96917.1 hypothetical protein C5C19_13095 [Pseudoclavibacter sp. RFBH5]PPG23604.1 hypothetical protein C5E13_08480 [Pseudoclavibacter sp. RFBI4]